MKTKIKSRRRRKSKLKVKQIFSSKNEYIEYAFGEDPILVQALKNCEE